MRHSRWYRAFHWAEGFRKRHKKLLIAFVLFWFFLLVWPLNLLGMAPVWSWPVTVQVVDAETGMPLQGVIVQADWPSVTGTLAGGHYRWGTIRDMETRTDEKGFFHLPGWIRVGFRNWISETDPEIRLYKAGYWPRTLKNSSSKSDEIILWPELWISDWNGEEIELEPMHWREWSKEEWKENEKKGMGGPSFENCGWIKYPEVIIEDLRFLMRRREVFGQPRKRLDELAKLWHEEEQKCGIKVFSLIKKHGFTEQEWKACCEYEAAKHLSPHSAEIMMQRFKVMPDGRWMPLEPEKVRIKTNSPADQLKHSGKE